MMVNVIHLLCISLSGKSKKATVKASAVDHPAPCDESATVDPPALSNESAAVDPSPSDPPSADAQPARRYPRRNLPPTNYAALESPNEDDFICKLWRKEPTFPISGTTNE